MGRIGKMKPRKEIRRCGMDGGEVGRCAGDTIPHGKLKLHAHAPHAWTTQRSEKTPVKRGGESLLVWHGGYPINCIPETSQFLAQKQRNHGVGLHGGVILAVGQDDALAVARGAASVEDIGDV